MAATSPRNHDPVSSVAAKPAMAPTIIIPSTPRFRTPDFSTTSSPSAANSSGVAATISATMIATGLSEA